MTKDKEIIQKQREIIKNLKEVGLFYFKCRNRATKDDVDKMETLHDKGISLESELAALESETEIDYDKLREVNSPCLKGISCNLCQSIPNSGFNDCYSKLIKNQSEPEERKTAEEIMNKLVFTDKEVLNSVGEDIEFVSKRDAVEALHEFASQSLPEISEEEIEQWADTHSAFIGVGNMKNNNLAKQVSFMQGARRYRDELKRRLK